MPAHNERELLAETVTAVVEGLRARAGDFEVLVIENGSVDDTYELAQELAARFDELRVETFPKADYGAALRRGLLSRAATRSSTSTSTTTTSSSSPTRSGSSTAAAPTRPRSSSARSAHPAPTTSDRCRAAS